MPMRKFCGYFKVWWRQSNQTRPSKERSFMVSPNHVNCRSLIRFSIDCRLVASQKSVWLDVKVEPVEGRLVELLGRQFKKP